MATLIGSTAKVMSRAIGTATTAAVRSAATKPKARTKPAAKPASLARVAPVRPRTAPKAAHFTAGSFGCEAGTRDYKLYVPATAGGPLPLLVMLHGCGQTPDDFARGTRMNALAEEQGVIVLYPAQSREAHANRCWNWFRAGDQRRNEGEPAILAGMVRQILSRESVDPARIYVAGLSAGASAALALAQAYPDLFAAVGCHSGLPMGAARDHGSALMAMQRGNSGLRLVHALPTIIFHGSDDRVVAPRNGRLVALRALEPFARLEMTEQARQIAQGRAYIRTSHRVGRGRSFVEHWLIKGSGHAWSGGSRRGRFVDPAGPDASREMLRFFLRHKTTLRRRRTAPD